MVKGEIMLNNRPIGPFIHRSSGFVHQDDLFDGSLTVLEHLTFIVSVKKYVFFVCKFMSQTKIKMSDLFS